MKKFEFKIHGPIKGGKNHINITRTGHRYPNHKWAMWRNMIVYDLKGFMPDGFQIFDKPITMKVVYTPADLKRRDLPAILDSIFHVMEKANLVTDDFLVKDLIWESRPKDKENAGASIFLEELPYALGCIRGIAREAISDDKYLNKKRLDKLSHS